MKYTFLFASSYASKNIKVVTVVLGEKSFDGVFNLENSFRLHWRTTLLLWSFSIKADRHCA